MTSPQQRPPEHLGRPPTVLWVFIGLIMLNFVFALIFRFDNLFIIDGWLAILIAMTTFLPRSPIWQLPAFVAIVVGVFAVAVLSVGAWFLMFLIWASHQTFH